MYVLFHGAGIKAKNKFMITKDFIKFFLKRCLIVFIQYPSFKNVKSFRTVKLSDFYTGGIRIPSRTGTVVNDDGKFVLTRRRFNRTRY